MNRHPLAFVRRYLKSYPAPALGAFVLTGVLLVLCRPGSSAQNQVPAGPQNLAEVMQLADSLGLHYRSDIQDGRINNRLILSEAPLNWERAASLWWSNPKHPNWSGIVALDTRREACEDYLPSAHAAVWGDMFLYGDPALIQKLLRTTNPGRLAGRAAGMPGEK